MWKLFSFFKCSSKWKVKQSFPSARCRTPSFTAVLTRKNILGFYLHISKLSLYSNNLTYNYSILMILHSSWNSTFRYKSHKATDKSDLNKSNNTFLIKPKLKKSITIKVSPFMNTFCFPELTKLFSTNEKMCSNLSSGIFKLSWTDSKLIWIPPKAVSSC